MGKHHIWTLLFCGALLSSLAGCNGSGGSGAPSAPGVQTNPQATLAIVSTPQEASVFVDDQYRGRTPLTVNDLQPGLHTVRIELQGYDPEILQIDIPAGGSDRVEVTLTYSIAGSVQDAGGGPIEGATVSLSTGRSIQTDQEGTFTVSDLSGPVTISVQKDGWTFLPQSITVSEPGDALHFEGTYTVSGNVTSGGEPLPAVDILISTGQTAQTDQQGSFSVAGLSGTVTITPQKDGWTFLPPSVALLGPSHVTFQASRVPVAAPVINEVLVRNDFLEDPAFLDPKGTKQGWIELYNPTEEPLDLRGFVLENDSGKSWAFPDLQLAAGDFLIIWMTTGEEATAQSLSAGFTLMESDEILLRDPKGSIIESVAVGSIPPDRSWGRERDGEAAWTFFELPTPGAPNSQEAAVPFVLSFTYLSLPVGVRTNLPVLPDQSVVWESDNPLIEVDSRGFLFAGSDTLAPEGQGRVYVRSSAYETFCEVTVVPWSVGPSELRIISTPDHITSVLGENDGRVFVAFGREIYSTADGARTLRYEGQAPASLGEARLLFTPAGFFLRSSRRIYRSEDLQNWELSLTLAHSYLRQMFCAYFDQGAARIRLYAGEYSYDDPSDRHAVYRGSFDLNGEGYWRKILEFPSLAEWQDDRSLFEAVRHIHVVAVDPYTGHVWVGTGDKNVHSRIYVSEDAGDTFKLLGMGSQSWRTLAIWFTEKYVYWDTDSTAPQSIWRIPRRVLESKGTWPSITPELKSGSTKQGVKYLVLEDQDPKRFPVSPGAVYTESEQRPLDSAHRVIALNDPDYDYRQKVAELANGSQWHQAWAVAEDGRRVSLLGASAEGALRDYRGRLFGIVELEDGTCDVQELMSFLSTTPGTYVKYVRPEPCGQDASGAIYLRGRYTPHRFYIGRLTWNPGR